MQLYKHNTNHDGTHKEARGWSVDAAQFAEELVEIYSTPTPTPNAMAKVGKIVLIECSCLCTITGVQYLYPKPKHESYSNTTYYNSWNKRKLHNLIISWTLIFLIYRVQHVFLAPLKYSPLTSSADVIYKIADSDITSKSTDTDSHPIDSLDNTILEALSFRVLLPKFWCKQCVKGAQMEHPKQQ